MKPLFGGFGRCTAPLAHANGGWFFVMHRTLAHTNGWWFYQWGWQFDDEGNRRRTVV